MSRGSSISASGLPPASATTRSRTRTSSGPCSWEFSSARASGSPSPPTRSSGNAAQLGVLAPVADREDHRHGLGDQAAGDEGQRLRRHAVQPLGIVDQADDRALVRRLREQPEDGEPDEEAIRRAAGAEAERPRERVPLRRRQPVPVLEHRPAELMQPGERELHLRFGARDADDATATRLPGEVVEQDRFAHARVAADHQRAAAPGPHLGQELVERGAFPAPAEQPLRATNRHRRRRT